MLKAVHNRPGAFKATCEEAGGLDPVICIAQGAKVMLCANVWVDVGLVNDTRGTIVAICYENGHSPPDLPVAVMVRFDCYSGPTLSDGSVPTARCIAHGLQATTSVQDCRFRSSWPGLSSSTSLK